MANTEYERICAETSKATDEFRVAQMAYRARQIPDSLFLEAKAKHDAAQAAFDVAYATMQA